MTIIIGIKRKNGDVWIGSDSLIVDDDLSIDPANMANDNKIVSFKNGFIGHAGDLSARNYLELYFENQENFNFDLKTKIDVFKFAISFKKFVRELVPAEGNPENGPTHELLNADFLIATKDKLYSLDSDNAVMEYKNFICIGRGSEMATGIIDYLYYKTTKTSDLMITEACEIVSKYHHSCGGPINLVNVNQKLKTKKHV